MVHVTGQTPSQGALYGSSRQCCEDRLSPTSIYRLLHVEGGRLFPDEAFADLFQDVGRCSVPPRIVSTVMTLQRLEGLSDREAVERFSFDLRWKYACGGLEYEYAGFVHTVLVDMRARLRKSKRPNRVFESVLAVARAADLVGRRRVLDSTALYDAVATQDTVTLVRSAIRALVRIAEEPLALPKGRTVRVHPHEKTLQRTRRGRAELAWRSRYKATRPKVERKFAQLMFRRHGGRPARVRGCQRVGQDFAVLAAAVNIRRLAILRVRFDARWTR